MKYFIAGTDTGVGKTVISVALLQEFNRVGYQTIGLKPIAAGGVNYSNEDALALQQAASIKLPYEVINPFYYAIPAAPFIAANQIDETLSVDAIVKKIQAALELTADYFIIEGAGGWLTPLNNQETMADIVLALELPVILVIGMRLGNLNHALLTARVIEKSGLQLVGWIGNVIDPHFAFLDENIAFLRQYLHNPCLGIVGYGQATNGLIDISAIIGCH